MTSIRLSEIRHLVEETLAAGTLLPPPRRFAKPGPARAPRPPDSHTRNPPLISWEDRWRAAPYDKLLEYRSLRVQLVRSAASAGYGSCYPEGFADRLRLEETRNKMYDLAFFHSPCHRLPPRADSSCPPPPLPRAPGMGGLLRYSFTLRQNSSSLSVFGSWK